MVEDKNSVLAEALRARQVELHRSSVPVAVGAAAFTAATLATMLWGSVAPAALVSWLVALLLAFGLRFGILIWHRTAAPATAVDAVWLGRYRFAFFVHGVVWGLASMLPMAAGDPSQKAILVFVLVAVSVSGALFAASDLTAGLLFGLPVLLLLSFELLSQAESWAAREWGEQPRRGYPAFTDR